MRQTKDFGAFYWLFKDYFEIDCEKVESITINDGLITVLTKDNETLEYELLDLIGYVYEDLRTFKNDLNHNGLEE